ncbi:MAG: 50S ribosomal protein L29 [Elusimicrobiota bacterium]
MAKKNEKEFDYKEANVETLTQRLNKSSEDLFKLRFKTTTTPASNTMEIRNIKREIARLNTFINQRRNNP